MSSTLPTNLEDMQYEILQGDLSANPRLQASAIPAKDKELKTSAKKIIPAINELLKLVTTCKQSVETYSNQVEDKVNEVAEALQETLKANQLEAINAQMSQVEGNIEQLIEEMKTTIKKEFADQITEQINEMQQSLDQLIEEKVAQSNTGTGGKALKRVFHSKVTIEKGGTYVAPFKISELQDVQRQFDAYNYSKKSSKYTRIENPFEFTTDVTSNYNTYTRPLDFRVDTETEEITLVNVSGLYDIVVVFFTLE